MVSYPRHYAIQCPSNELSDAQSLAWAAIFLYPVGVVLLSAWLLYLSRQALLLEEQSTPYTRSIAFLHAPFVPKFFYFELLELTKKLLLIGFASACHQSESNPVLQLSTCSPHTRVPFSSCSVTQLIEPGSLLQIMVAVIISLLFLVLHLQSMPFRKPLDNVLATMVNLSLVVFFIWCMLLQTGALGNEDAGRLSDTGEAVSVLMLISIVGVLLVTIILFVLETAAKTATHLAEQGKREKWAGCTIDPPMTKWSGDKSYACFLSHVYAARLELLTNSP